MSSINKNHISGVICHEWYTFDCIPFKIIKATNRHKKWYVIYHSRIQRQSLKKKEKKRFVFCVSLLRIGKKYFMQICTRNICSAQYYALITNPICHIFCLVCGLNRLIHHGSWMTMFFIVYRLQHYYVIYYRLCRIINT